MLKEAFGQPVVERLAEAAKAELTYPPMVELKKGTHLEFA